MPFAFAHPLAHVKADPDFVGAIPASTVGQYADNMAVLIIGGIPWNVRCIFGLNR